MERTYDSNDLAIQQLSDTELDAAAGGFAPVVFVLWGICAGIALGVGTAGASQAAGTWAGKQ